MAWRHREVVDLPDDLAARDLNEIGLFLLDRVDLTDGYTRIETFDRELTVRGLLPEVWAWARQTERLEYIAATMWSYEIWVLLEWRRAVDSVGPPSRVTIEGTNDTLVRRLAVVTRLFVERGIAEQWPAPTRGAARPYRRAEARDEATSQGTNRPAPPQGGRQQDRPRRWPRWLAPWAHDLSVEVVGGLLVAVVLALASIMWVIVH